MYRTRLAGNAGCKKSPSAHHCITLSGYIFATEVHIDNRKKNLLNSNVSPTCPHSMVNFGPLAAEICWWVWGTPANFNGFRVFAALLHGTLVVGVSQTAALNKGHHLYSAGWPSRWELAHILVRVLFKVDHITRLIRSHRIFLCPWLSWLIPWRWHEALEDWTLSAYQ